MRDRALRSRAPASPNRSRTVVARRRRDALAAATDQHRLPGNRAVSTLVRSVPVQRSVADIHTLTQTLQAMANTGAASYDARVLAMVARVVAFMARGHDEATASELRLRVQSMREQWLADPALGKAVKAQVRRKVDPSLVVVRGTSGPRVPDVAPVSAPEPQPLGVPFNPGHRTLEPAAIPFNPGNRPLSLTDAPFSPGLAASRLQPGVPSFAPGAQGHTAAPFVPGPRTPIPSPALLPPVGTAGFESMYAAGRIRVVAVRWWRAADAPNHNIELCVMADGRPWALVDVAWRDREGPTRDNVEAVTFKSADGSPLNGGAVGFGAAYEALLTEALRYADSAPATQSEDVPVPA